MPAVTEAPEPSIESPGADARVGTAAAAFAAGAAGGAIGERVTGSGDEPSDTQVRAADDLLLAKVAEIKAAQAPAVDEQPPEPGPTEATQTEPEAAATEPEAKPQSLRPKPQSPNRMSRRPAPQNLSPSRLCPSTIPTSRRLSRS